MQIRPRRSVLYMPGANERALEKAKTLPADSLILDLEDSVAPDGKAEARTNVCSAVKAGGTMLQPGTYEIRDTGEHVMPLPGQSGDAQTHVEFVANGMVVARDIAELMPVADAPVGTSGGGGRGRFDMLKGGDFARVSMSHGGERYLIHLAVAK